MGNNITDRLKYKESIVKFSRKYEVAKAAYKFGECKRTIQGLYHAMQRLGIYKKHQAKRKKVNRMNGYQENIQGIRFK